MTKILMLFALLMTVSACSVSNGPGNPFGSAPSAAEYAQMNEEERAAATAAVQQGAADKNSWWLEIGLPIYLSGEPVEVGSKATGRTLQWDPLLRVTYVYAGHANGPGGIEQNSTQAFKTDAHGNILDGAGQLLANVSTQEGIGRFGARLGTQIIAPIGSGALAAQIHANAACDSDCAAPAVINQIAASAMSQSAAEGHGTASAGTGCPTGGCGRESFTGFGQ